MGSKSGDGKQNDRVVMGLSESAEYPKMAILLREMMIECLTIKVGVCYFQTHMSHIHTARGKRGGKLLE